MTTKNMDWSDPTLGQSHDPHRRIVMLGLASWATLGLQACGGGGGTTTPPKVAVVSTLAGSGAADWADGTGVDAKFNHPNGLALDTSGNVYVSDEFNHRIRIISTAGVVSNYAGSGNTNADGDGEFAEGTGTGASFFHPNGICLLTNGDLIVADAQNHRLRRITSSRVVSTYVGSDAHDLFGNGIYGEGTGTGAGFVSPSVVALDQSGQIFVADNSIEGALRFVDRSSVTTTLIENLATKLGEDGFCYVTGMALDATNRRLYFSVEALHKIYVMNLLGQDIQLLAGSTEGHADGVGSSASFRTPMGLALDPEGNLIVADYGNHLIRKVTPAGLVTSVAGSGEIDSSTPGNFGVFRDGTGTAAAFNCPLAVAVDTHGNIFVSDTYNHRIRKITWA